MNTDRKYEPIKENRGRYFIEYYPPCGERFAVLQLVILEDTNTKTIARTMEKELVLWLNKYPIPLFVSAFDNKGDLYDLQKTNKSNHLIGFFDKTNKVVLHWESLKDDEIPDNALNQEYVDKIYSDLRSTTYNEIKKKAEIKYKNIRIGWLIFFVWLVVLPAIIAIFEHFNYFISAIAMIYSLYKAIRKGLELTGKWPKSKKEKEKEDEDRLKDHYYYHCQMNPEGFTRLKLENFERMEKNSITKEAQALQKKNSSN